MTGYEFWEKVHEHPKLVYAGVSVQGEILVQYTPILNVSALDKHIITWSIEPRSILSCAWEDLLEVLTGLRSPTIMRRVETAADYQSYLKTRRNSRLDELAGQVVGNFGLPGIVEVCA
jgi:hypothetical protein